MENLSDLARKAGVFLAKSIDQGIYGHFQIDSEFLIKFAYYDLMKPFYYRLISEFGLDEFLCNK